MSIYMEKKKYWVNMTGPPYNESESNQNYSYCGNIFCFNLFAFLAQFKGLFKSFSYLETGPLSPSLRHLKGL